MNQSTPPARPNRPALTIYALGLLCTLGIGLANFLVDPYLYFNSPRFDGINRWKTQYFWNQLETKSQLVKDAGISTLIVGTSTAGDSIDPAHPVFRDSQTFNFAIAGSSPRIHRLAFAHTASTNPLRSLVICIDLFVYNELLSNTILENWASRLAPSQSTGQRWMRWRQNVEAQLTKLFSWGTLRDTLRTVNTQDAGGPSAKRDDILANGFWSQPRRANTSQRDAFAAIEQHYLTAGWFPDPYRRFELNTAAGHPQLDELRGLLADASRAGVTVSIAIMPSHARYNEAMHEAGLWDDFEELKRKLVQIASDPALAGAHIRVWDFSGYNSIGMDTVKNAAQETPWYKDSIHPTAATGNLMLTRMFGPDQTMPQPPGDFGRELKLGNVEQQLADARARRGEYLELHAADANDVRRLAAKAQSWRDSADSAEH